MTDIYEIGIPAANSASTPGRPSSQGQWTSINVLSVESGGSGGDSAGELVISRGPDGALTGGRRGARVGLSAASQIVSSVALPMPDNLQFRYGADWTADGTGTIERSIARVDEGLQGNDASIPASTYGDLKNQLVKLGNSTAFRSTLAARGLTHNPHKEMFYNSPQFRSFPLQWEMSFTSKAEADRFDQMVEALLIHMHPEFQDGALAGVWKIPESFRIEFENAKTRTISDSVLTALDVDYASSGAGWKAFSDGNPAHVSLSMTFMEIKPLTKEDIRSGR